MLCEAASFGSVNLLQPILIRMNGQSSCRLALSVNTVMSMPTLFDFETMIVWSASRIGCTRTVVVPAHKKTCRLDRSDDGDSQFIAHDSAMHRGRFDSGSMLDGFSFAKLNLKLGIQVLMLTWLVAIIQAKMFVWLINISLNNQEINIYLEGNGFMDTSTLLGVWMLGRKM